MCTRVGTPCCFFFLKRGFYSFSLWKNLIFPIFFRLFFTQHRIIASVFIRFSPPFSDKIWFWRIDFFLGNPQFFTYKPKGYCLISIHVVTFTPCLLPAQPLIHLLLHALILDRIQGSLVWLILYPANRKIGNYFRYKVVW